MGTYWENTGKYQSVYDHLLGLGLVPAEGPAPTHAGEVLRSLGNVYYDYFNNGGGNIPDCYRDAVAVLVRKFPDEAKFLVGALEAYDDAYNEVDEGDSFEDARQSAFYRMIDGKDAEFECLADAVILNVFVAQGFPTIAPA